MEKHFFSYYSLGEKAHIMILRVVVLMVLSALPLFAQTLPPVVVTKNTAPSPGKILIAPNSRVPNPPYSPALIELSNEGVITKSRFIPEYAFDFRPLPDGRYGYSVFQSAGTGPRASSTIYFVDSTLATRDSIAIAPNRYNIAMHSFMVLPNGNTLLVLQEDVTVDMSKIVPGGHPAASVQQMLLQEIDAAGKLIFQWRALDHFPVTVSYENLTAPSIRYFHLNAVDVDTDGHFLISARHSSLVAKIHRTTGEVLWILGGKLNQFTFTSDPSITDPPEFSYQHDIRRLPNGNISLFDNGTQRTPQWSRGVEYRLDEVNKTCTLVWQYRNVPDIYAGVQGSMQTLLNGNRLLAWGSALLSNRSLINEVTPAGEVVFQAELPSMMYPYKAEKIDVDYGKEAASVLIDEILPTNTYVYTRGTDTVGLKITYHTLISFFYNTTTATRFNTSPLNPRWGVVRNGALRSTVTPSYIAPTRLTITQEGMVEHAGEFRFHAPTFGLQNPASLIVYRRDTIGKGVFVPMRTRYNSVTQELIVDTAQVGEFCFGLPRPQTIAQLQPPRQITPTGGKRLLVQQPVVLQSSGQGYTQAYQLEVFRQSPSGPVQQYAITSLVDKTSVPSNPMQLNEPGMYTWTSRAVWLDSLTSAETSVAVLDSFQLTDAFIDLTSPSSKVSWMQDSAYAITWETNIPGAATIELIRNGTPVHVIADSVRAASGGFLWKVPVAVPEGTDYDIVIRSRDGNEFVASDATADQRVTIVKLPVSVEEERQQIACEVMPNPASTTLFISSEKEVSEVHIYATSGELVLRERVAGVGARLDVQHIPTGVYMLHVVTTNGSVTRPVIINR